MRINVPSSNRSKNRAETAEIDAVKAEGALQEVVDRLGLMQATEFARSGKFNEAEHLINELSQITNTTPHVIDLMARIRCQQGRLYEAEALWSKASRLDPDNETYRAGLRRIARMQRRPVWLTSSLSLLAGSLVIVAIIIASLTIRNYFRELRDSVKLGTQDVASNAAKTTSALPPTGNRQAESSLQEVRQRTSNSPAINVNLPGISQQEDETGLILIFDSGLFTHRDTLRPEAQSLLMKLGKQLESNAGRIEIKIVGHTDDLAMRSGSSFEDNFSLGMSRAIAVLKYLKRYTRLPASSLSVSSSGESQPPYPNNTPQNRAKNQTVTLNISER